jgi:hypothetical protein
MEPSAGGSVEVVELKLGNLDFGRQHQTRTGGRSGNKGTEVLTWQPQQRVLYGSPYLSAIDSRYRAANAGTSPRELHFAVFDALAPSPKSWLGGRSKKQTTVYVGRGARTYAVIGGLLPGGIVGWMLGLRTGYAVPVTEVYDDSHSNNNSETGWEKLA